MVRSSLIDKIIFKVTREGYNLVGEFICPLCNKTNKIGLVFFDRLKPVVECSFCEGMFPVEFKPEEK